MDMVISKSNDKVKLVKSLNEKKFRQKYNLFYLEGVKVVEEVLNMKKAIDILFIAYSDTILKTTKGGIELLSKIDKENIETIHLCKNIFEYVTDTKTPQGILVVLRIPEYDILKEIKESKKNIVILDEIQDAGNIGTIIRTADAFNIGLILCKKGTTDVYSPKVVRSTMGSILRVHIAYIEEDIIKKIKEIGYDVIGTSLKSSKNLNEINYSKKLCFIFGNESSGVRKEILKLCNYNIKIEMSEKSESLNVGVAAGIILYKQYINNLDN